MTLELTKEQSHNIVEDYMCKLVINMNVNNIVNSFSLLKNFEKVLPIILDKLSNYELSYIYDVRFLNYIENDRLIYLILSDFNFYIHHALEKRSDFFENIDLDTFNRIVSNVKCVSLYKKILKASKSISPYDIDLSILDKRIVTYHIYNYGGDINDNHKIKKLYNYRNTTIYLNTSISISSFFINNSFNNNRIYT